MSIEYELLSTYDCVVGLDEVGRGAVAGPLVVGAVVIDGSTSPPTGLNDSKLLSARQRENMIQPIREWSVEFAIGEVSANEIDTWGMRTCLALAGWRALRGLTRFPQAALVDGSFDFLRLRPSFDDVPLELEGSELPALPTRSIIRGDQICVSIAAASIVAKVHRDSLMDELSEQVPGFGWERNKGYLTSDHADALGHLGQTLWHRRSWAIPG